MKSEEDNLLFSVALLNLSSSIDQSYLPFVEANNQPCQMAQMESRYKNTQGLA